MGYNPYAKDYWRKNQPDWSRDLTRIPGASSSGGSNYYYDDSGAVYGVDARGNKVLVKDPWTEKWSDKARKDVFQRNLAIYDTESQKYRDQVMRAFQGSAELNAARQQRGVQAGVNQYLARRGIAGESGLGASLAASTQGQLASQVSQATSDFNSTLLSAMRAERNAFINGEFDFWHRLQVMDYGAQLQKDIISFQNKLAQDNAFRDAFFSVMGLGGQVIGALSGGGGGSSYSGGSYGGGGQARSLQDMYSDY